MVCVHTSDTRVEGGKLWDPDKKIKVSQFEVTKTPYTAKDKKTGEMVEKISKKCEKVTKEMSFNEI